MLRARKSEIVDSLRGVFNAAGVVVVTHYQGMSVAEVTELRRGMREAGARFRVTKNRLAKIALADTPYSPLAGLFTGPTAIAFSSDPVAAPKAAVGYAKRNEKLAIIGGALGGSLLDARAGARARRAALDRRGPRQAGRRADRAGRASDQRAPSAGRPGRAGAGGARGPGLNRLAAGGGASRSG